jgi:hypothetical protein
MFLLRCLAVSAALLTFAGCAVLYFTGGPVP